MELMAMVFTSMRRPSARVHIATNATARAGVLLEESTRMNVLPGRP
jgi:hypothetical protein